MTTRVQILRGIILLSGNRVLGTPLSFLRELLVSGLLGPLVYGSVNFVNFVLAYASLSGLGIGAAANREILFFKGRQDLERVTLIRNAGMTASLLLAVAFGAGVTALTLLGQPRSVPWIVHVTLGPLVFLLVLQSWCELAAVTGHAFGVLAKLRFWGAIIGFAVAVGSTSLFGVGGLLVGLVGVQLGMVCWLAGALRLRYAPTVCWGETWRLLRLGFPLFLGSLSVLMLRTIDNFMVLTFLSVAEWGYYGFALFISTYLFNVVNESARVVYQFVQERYGERNEVRSLRNYIVVPARAVAYFFPVVIGLLVLASPVLLARFLPQYLPAMPALTVLLVAAYFSSIQAIHGLLTLVLERQKFDLLLRTCGIVLNVGCAMAFLWLGWGLVGIALASAIAWGGYSLVLVWMTSGDLALSRREFAVYLGDLLVPLGYTLIVIGGLRELWPVSAGEIPALLVQVVIFLGCSAPLVIRGSATTGIFDVIRSRRLGVLDEGVSSVSHRNGRLKRAVKSTLKRIPYFHELNFFRANRHYYVRMLLARLGIVAPPEIVMLELTNACNLKCVMCGTPTAKRKTGLMSWGVYRTALEQAYDLGVRRVVLYTTGESLLHRELPKMVKEAKTRGFQVFLSTNGILLDERRAIELLDAGLDQLRFSIEGATKETYESVRVGGRHERLLANMKRLRQLRDDRKSSMGITVNSVYMRETASEVGSFYGVYGSLVDYIEFSYLGNQGNHMPEILRTSSTVPVNGGGTRPCSLLWRSMVVSWNGDVTVCCVDLENEMVVDNIAHHSLGAIWRNEAYQRYRRLHLQGRQAELKLCSGCTSIQSYAAPYQQFRLNKALRALANGSGRAAAEVQAQHSDHGACADSTR